MQTITKKLPSTKDLYRRRGALAGFATGIFVPLVLVGLVLVSFRGYGIMDEAPAPPQVYTNF